MGIAKLIFSWNSAGGPGAAEAPWQVPGQSRWGLGGEAPEKFCFIESISTTKINEFWQNLSKIKCIDKHLHFQMSN